MAETGRPDDEVWRRDEIESPCVKVCVIHPDPEICVGCFRTRAEIAGWSRMSPEARREIMAALPAREPMLRAAGRRGGSRRRRGPAPDSGDNSAD